MRCQELRTKLGALWEGALAEADKREAQAHLDGCERCSRDYQALLLAESLLQRYGRRRIEAPPDLVQRAMRGLGNPPPGVVREIWRLAAAAAVVLACLGVGTAALDLQPAVEEVKDQASEAREYVTEEIPKMIQAGVSRLRLPWEDRP